MGARLGGESDSTRGWLADRAGRAPGVLMLELEGDLGLGRVDDRGECSLLGLLNGGGREHARSTVEDVVAVGGGEREHHI